jgi:hypothetical protein
LNSVAAPGHKYDAKDMKPVENARPVKNHFSIDKKLIWDKMVLYLLLECRLMSCLVKLHWLSTLK